MDVPDELSRRARALVDGDGTWTPPPVRDAATVALCRDAHDGSGIEVFVLRRVRSMAFAAGMHVFPGGAVEPTDEHVPWHAGADVDERRLTASPSLARALVAAAVRETFEECGVLLAVDADGRAASPTADELAGWEQARVEVLDGRLGFADLLRRHDLAIDATFLAAWDHWITPAVENRRYDTRFFVAAQPAGQHAQDVGGEADRVRWVSPTDALTACRAGQMAMLPPTYATLVSLEPFASVAEVMAAAPARTIRPLLPEPSIDDAGGVRWDLVDARDGTVVGEA